MNINIPVSKISSIIEKRRKLPKICFSFFWKKISNIFDAQVKADIAASFQNAAIEILVAKIKKAIIQTGHKSIVISGGVAANNALRNQIKSLEDEFNCKVFYPSMKHCTDNAAMIAYLGSLKSVDKNQTKNPTKINQKPFKNQ